VRTARLLILEVTFLDDRVSTERARRSGHVHIDELVKRIDLLENEAILCTHVSRRHHGQMKGLFRAQLPLPEHARFVLLEPEPPWV
jgi:ribonuclease Z